MCGPVVVSCVCFKERAPRGLRDSKELSARKREELFRKIIVKSRYSFGLVREDLVDELNVLKATQLAFARAIEKFLKATGFRKEDVLFIIDGPLFDHHDRFNAKCVIGADKKIKVVSAASILAKVLRDKIMCGYDRIFSDYGFFRHKGYGTKEHRRRIKKHGASPIHRTSFNLVGK